MRLEREKRGELEMEFRLDPTSGRTILTHLYRRVPLVVQQALYFDEELPLLPCVYILSSGGPYVESDRHSIRISLGEGAMAHISTGAATQIGSMERDVAECRQQITLSRGAYLEWLPRALIPSRESTYRCHTEVVAHPEATFCIGEVVACGRLHSGERFDYTELHLSTTIVRPTGQVVARDGLRLRPQIRHPSEPSLLGGFTHFGTAIIGSTPEVVDAIYDLVEPILRPDSQLSIARIGGGCGLIVRLLGNSAEQIGSEIRRLCSIVRTQVKGVPLPPEFLWR